MDFQTKIFVSVLYAKYDDYGILRVVCMDFVMQKFWQQ